MRDGTRRVNPSESRSEMVPVTSVRIAPMRSSHCMIPPHKPAIGEYSPRVSLWGGHGAFGGGTPVGALARRGCGDATRAARLLAESGLADAAHEVIVDALCRAADPDLALCGLVRILERSADPGVLLSALHEDADFRERLCQVVGARRALAGPLARPPGDWRPLRGAEAARALALLGLVRIVERSADPGELLSALPEDADFRERLCQVVGRSRALADHLVRHPGDWGELRGADAARPPDAEELRAGLLAVVEIGRAHV